jgi:hypothetical protein
MGSRALKISGFPPEACGNDVGMVPSDTCFLPDTQSQGPLITMDHGAVVKMDYSKMGGIPVRPWI